MEINLVNPNKLTITLNQQDISELNFDYEHIQQSAPAREILVELLEQGRLRTGFHPSKAKLIVEVLPHENGGCVISFTAMQNTYFPLRERAMLPVIFEFDDAESLIEGSCRVFQQYSHRIYKSSLYRFAAKYRLILYPLDYSDKLSVYFLSEYGYKVGEGELLAAYTEEHGQELIRDTALDLLAEHFGTGTERRP